MATTFSTAKVGLDEIAARIQQHRKALENAKAGISSAKAALDGMATTYGQLVGDIDAAVTADPEDVAWANLKAEKDNLVAEFVTLTGTAGSMKTALDGITV